MKVLAFFLTIFKGLFVVLQDFLNFVQILYKNYQVFPSDSKA